MKIAPPPKWRPGCAPVSVNDLHWMNRNAYAGNFVYGREITRIITLRNTICVWLLFLMPFYVFFGALSSKIMLVFSYHQRFSVYWQCLHYPTETVLLIVCIFSCCSYNRFQLVVIFCKVYLDTRITIKTAFCSSQVLKISKHTLSFK